MGGLSEIRDGYQRPGWTFSTLLEAGKRAQLEKLHWRNKAGCHGAYELHENFLREIPEGSGWCGLPLTGTPLGRPTPGPQSPSTLASCCCDHAGRFSPEEAHSSSMQSSV